MLYEAKAPATTLMMDSSASDRMATECVRKYAVNFAAVNRKLTSNESRMIRNSFLSNGFGVGLTKKGKKKVTVKGYYLKNFPIRYNSKLRNTLTSNMVVTGA